ncbi:MAG TPA: GTPase [Thermoanaerobaculia bacterium]
MTANLTPQYHDAEERFKRATDHAEKLAALREMIALLPKHKGTEKMLAHLRKQVSKLEDEAAAAPRGGHGHRVEIGHVRREGAGQWVLLGPPNAGKSSLLAALTHAHPEIGEYPFTTRAPLPGMLEFEDVQVQLVDTPAVAEGHTEAYLPNLAHDADGVLLVVDVTTDDSGAPLLHDLLARARVWPRSRPLPPDAPSFLQHKPVLVLGNKSEDDDGTFATIAREAIGADLPFFGVSALTGAGLEPLRGVLFRELRRIRVYGKEPGRKPDMDRPFVLPEGSTIHDLAVHVHKEIAERMKFARIWGHAKFDGQQVDRHHVLADKDVVELHA